jgi:hypothetical protein
MPGLAIKMRPRVNSLGLANGLLALFTADLATGKEIEMDKRNICIFMIGLSIGAGVALLFAPRSGKKTRTRIAEAAADGAAYAKECGETVRDTTLDVIGRGTKAYKKAVG